MTTDHEHDEEDGRESIASPRCTGSPFPTVVR